MRISKSFLEGGYATIPAMKARRTYNLNLTAHWIPDVVYGTGGDGRNVVALRSGEGAAFS